MGGCDRNPGALLVVEEDAVLLDMIAAILRDAGWHLVAATTFGAAKAALATASFALVPADSAGGSMAEMRDHWPALGAVAGDIPVVICRAHASRTLDGDTARGFAGLPRAGIALRAVRRAQQLGRRAVQRAPVAAVPPAVRVPVSGLAALGSDWGLLRRHG